MSTPGATDSVPSEATTAHLLAQRLVARAGRKSKSPSGDASTAFAACVAMYGALARTIGLAGAAALLSRALSLSEKQHPLLRELPFDREGDEGAAALMAACEQHGAASTSAALVALLEVLLTLLERFLGNDMVARLALHGATIGTNEDEDTL